MSRVLGLTLAGLLLAGPVLAQPSREQALGDLRDASSVESRRRGAQMLGETGTMDDVPVLIGALRDADPIVRALAERGMWEIWSRSGDEQVDRLLAIGIEQMAAQEPEAAVETFSRVIARRPDFAEGWNKRATVYFHMGEYRKSLADCDEVMKRNPHHFGALAGYGLIYRELGELDRAVQYFERALSINPNLDGVAQAVEELRHLLLQRRKDTT